MTRNHENLFNWIKQVLMMVVSTGKMMVNFPKFLRSLKQVTTESIHHQFILQERILLNAKKNGHKDTHTYTPTY